MAPTLLDRVDATLGSGIERAMIRHHMRRLRRHGQLRALAPGSDTLWATTAPAPREGNRMEVLIDGANALPAMAEAIRQARHHVHICSWSFEPDFRPERQGGGSAVKELLAEAAERVPVRMLVWAGAPVPVFKPSRRTVTEAREQLV